MVYDTENEKDMIELEKKFPASIIKERKKQLKALVSRKEEKKKNEFKTGDCCPSCGSIEYYNSGTCKTCRTCGFAGGCG